MGMAVLKTGEREQVKELWNSSQDVLTNVFKGNIYSGNEPLGLCSLHLACDADLMPR